METIFEKPLDKQVAENTDHIATLISSLIIIENTGTVTTTADGTCNFADKTPTDYLPLFPINYPGYFINGASASYVPFLFGAQSSRTYNNTQTVFIKYQNIL